MATAASSKAPATDELPADLQPLGPLISKHPQRPGYRWLLWIVGLMGLGTALFAMVMLQLHPPSADGVPVEAIYGLIGFFAVTGAVPIAYALATAGSGFILLRGGLLRL